MNQRESLPAPQQDVPGDLDNKLSVDLDPRVLDRWDEGTARWGNAFVAYATLGRPERHTQDVLVDFQERYLMTFKNIEEVVQDHLDTYGWTDALTRFKREQSIDAEMLIWDHKAVIAQLEATYHLICLGGAVHVFWK